MGPESKGAAFQHTNPLSIVPGIRKMKPICFMQGKRLVVKLGQSKRGVWSRCRHLAGFLGVQHSQLETGFSEELRSCSGNKPSAQVFKTELHHAGSEHVRKAGPVMTGTRSLPRPLHILKPCGGSRL